MVHAKKDTLYIITKIPWGTFDPLQFQARACLFREKKIYILLFGGGERRTLGTFM